MHLNSKGLRTFFQVWPALVIMAVMAVNEPAQVPQDDDSSKPQPVQIPQASPDDPSPNPQATPAPSAKPEPSPEKRLIGNIFRDQRAILTSPLHLKGSDAKLLVPLALVTGGLISTDRRTANELIDNGNDPTRIRISNNIARIGDFYGVGSIAGTMYLFGRATHSARLRETGLLGAQAVIDGGITVTILKSVAQRPRPNFDNGRGDFLDGGASFPSGHATVSWALATVIAHEYKDNRLIGIGAYGVATVVGISRFTGRNHFLSDVFVGSAMGYGIGRYVYRHHHDSGLDAQGNDPPGNDTSGLTGSKLMPAIAPRFSRATSTYGLKLSWGI